MALESLAEAHLQDVQIEENTKECTDVDLRPCPATPPLIYTVSLVLNKYVATFFSDNLNHCVFPGKCVISRLVNAVKLIVILIACSSTLRLETV